MSLLTGLIGWILFSAVVGVGANTRGRNGFGWFALALVTSPLIAGLFLLALPRKDQKDPFADIATLAVIEATPDGSRSRQLLAEHEAKRAAEMAKRAGEAKRRQGLAIFIAIFFVVIYFIANISGAPSSNRTSAAVDHAPPSAFSSDDVPIRRAPLLCGIASC
jgi:hypothetical protein